MEEMLTSLEAVKQFLQQEANDILRATTCSVFIIVNTDREAICTSSDDDIDDLIVLMATVIRAKRRGELQSND